MSIATVLNWETEIQNVKFKSKLFYNPSPIVNQFILSQTL